MELHKVRCLRAPTVVRWPMVIFAGDYLHAVLISDLITGSGVSDEELKTIGSKALDTLECRDLKKQIELILTYYRKDARFVDNLMDITVSCQLSFDIT